MQTVIYLLLGLSYLAASSLVLSVVLAYQEATPDSPPPSTRHHLLATSVLGYLCGLQSLVCSCHSLTSRQMDKKLEQSSTQFTLQTAAASRAVTSDTIAARPPPAPRPIVRSQGQAGHPPLGLSNQNYSPPPRTKHPAPRHLQHNHYGGRGGGPPYPHKRSASPDTPPALHRSYPSSPGTPPSSPETAHRKVHRASPRTRDLSPRAQAPTFMQDSLPQRPNHSQEPSPRAANSRDPSPRGAEARHPSPRNPRHPNHPRNSRDSENPRESSLKPSWEPVPGPLNERTSPVGGEPSKLGWGQGDRPVDPGEPSKERLKGRELTSIHPADGTAHTGAIPKKRKKTGPNPSPYPKERPHPDEIICVSMEDVEDVQQQRKEHQPQHKHLPNLAH